MKSLNHEYLPQTYTKLLSSGLRWFKRHRSFSIIIIIIIICCKFLGLIIDDKLCWLDHINYININLSRSLYILTQLKICCLIIYTIKIYYTMVQPYLTYIIILWGSTYRSYLKRTVILQKKAIRYMHKANHNVHTKTTILCKQCTKH